MIKTLFKMGLYISILLIFIIIFSSIFLLGNTPLETLNNSENIRVAIVNKNNDKIGNGLIVSKSKVITSCHITKKLTTNFKIIYNNKFRKGQIIKKNKKLDLSLIKLNKNINYPNKMGFVKAEEGERIHSFSSLKNQNVKTGKILKNKDEINVKRKDYFYESNLKLEKGYSGGPVLNDNGNIIGINQGRVERNGNHIYSIIVSSQAIMDFLSNKKIKISDNYNSLGNKLCK